MLLLILVQYLEKFYFIYISHVDFCLYSYKNFIYNIDWVYYSN